MAGFGVSVKFYLMSIVLVFFPRWISLNLDILKIVEIGIEFVALILHCTVTTTLSLQLINLSNLYKPVNCNAVASFQLTSLLLITIYTNSEVT